MRPTSSRPTRCCAPASPDVIALTVDNAPLVRPPEKPRRRRRAVARGPQVHDRLGQWMTYLKMELERLANSDGVARPDLERLHDDAAFALDELRETLRQLRSGVSEDRPLSILGGDLVERFADRSDVAARFVVHHPDQRLPVPVENEILRILQEALNNVDRHAKAEHVEVDWTVDGGNYELTVSDDGCGFDTDSAVREQSYGLVGMRERAEVIGDLRDQLKTGRRHRLSVKAGARPRRFQGSDINDPQGLQPQEIAT
ncbi:MAG: histidine kinase [Microthrixaceae bacterium]|nr:histidine kinase [Microthrixaceae bacterium]